MQTAGEMVFSISDTSITDLVEKIQLDKPSIPDTDLNTSNVSEAGYSEGKLFQSLSIEIDSSFFSKEIFDSKTDNILRILTDQFKIAQDLINKERLRLLHDNNYIANNKNTINTEISRGSTYRFDQIEGEVNFESFRDGLIIVGVNPEDSKALDFLTLFIVQGYGAIAFSIGSAVILFLNKLLSENGIFATAIKGHQFKQKNPKSGELIIGTDLIKHAVTEVIEIILINYNSYEDGSSTTVGELKIVAAIDNVTLDVNFNSITLTFPINHQFTLRVVKALNDLGFKRLAKEGNTNGMSIIVASANPSLENEHKEPDNSAIIPDFRLIPYTLSELKELKRKPNHTVICSIQPEYSGNNFNLDLTVNNLVGLPQTRLERQARRLLDSKKFIQEGIKANIEISHRDNVERSHSLENGTLLSYINEAIDIFDNINNNITALDEVDFNEKTKQYSQQLAGLIKKISELFSTIYNQSVKDKAEVVLEHLNLILITFESSENLFFDSIIVQ